MAEQMYSQEGNAVAASNAGMPNGGYPQQTPYAAPNPGYQQAQTPYAAPNPGYQQPVYSYAMQPGQAPFAASARQPAKPAAPRSKSKWIVCGSFFGASLLTFVWAVYRCYVFYDMTKYYFYRDKGEQLKCFFEPLTDSNVMRGVEYTDYLKDLFSFSFSYMLPYPQCTLFLFVLSILLFLVFLIRLIKK